MFILANANVSQPAESNPNKHPNLWFNDGSVTLHVQDTLFRVHQSLLCSHSIVFTDMFNPPQPVVRMIGDSRAEWENTLRAIYDIRFLDQLTGVTVSHLSMSDISTIAGILRISSKYGMHAMRAKCVSILQKNFPCTFVDMLSVTSTRIEISERLSMSLAIAAVAFESWCPILLPAALYQVCMTLPVDGSGDDSLLESTVIPDSMKLICLSGRARIHGAEKTGDASLEHSSLTFEIYLKDRTFQKCQHGSFCFVLPRQPKLQNAGVSALSSNTPYDTLSSNVKFPGQMENCVLCSSKLKDAYISHQKAIWTCLPLYFRLGESWECLQKDQDEFDKEVPSVDK